MLMAGAFLVILATTGFCADPAHSQLKLLDLSGHAVNPLEATNQKATVFLFVRTDCPISNRYAPLVRRIYEKYSPQGVAFWLVYLDRSESAKTIERHRREFDYRCGALRDPQHALVKLTGARVTPEAAVFVPEEPSGSGARRLRMIYRGRIDDQYVDFGVAHPAPTTHDLENILEEIALGKTVQPSTTRAVGCFISDLK